ncbi:MAG: VOC family protein [Pseudomonadota bacterium]
MSTPKTIHHINILVRDLESKIVVFEKLLDKTPERRALQNRQVQTASFQLGETYLVLVSPTTKDSVVANILEEKGEGLFLLSFGVTDLEKAIDVLQHKNITNAVAETRTGIDNWKIQDIPLIESVGCILQFTELS